MTTVDLMSKIVSLCKRRGFIFQSSEIYGGLKSCYDYGPLGTELKKNIADEWWRRMVYEREDVYGLDASIMMHTEVWKASGHLANFTDPLVDCFNCQERFRADKAPKKEIGTQVEYRVGGQPKGHAKTGTADRGYVCPKCGAPTLSEERQFRGMFRATMGPIDPLIEYVEKNYEDGTTKDLLKKKIFEIQEGPSSVYLRPETAQAMFVQFLNVQQSMSAKIPFGIAQIGKSFRNEIITEHFVFRSCEFEQMELEFFCEPGSQKEWFQYWRDERLAWHRKYSNHPENYRLRPHEDKELAHYADGCDDVEYLYPWGWDEVEGIASRTDYDLSQHAKASGTKLSYFDQDKNDPETGKKGWRYVPYVIEPSLGLTRTLLCTILDAYTEETLVDANGAEKTRTVLKLHPRLAPYKVAILPLVKKDGQPELARKIAAMFRKKGIKISYDENQSIGRRYARHDEIGTPYCMTVDQNSLLDNQVTVRFRDTTQQERIPIEDAVSRIQAHLDSLA